MAKEKRWIVTTSGDQSLRDVEQRLSESGLEVDQVLDQIGVIVGTASDDAVEQLRSVAGVVDVSPEETIYIGPPGSSVTW